jgi:ATP-dependent Lon protease
MGYDLSKVMFIATSIHVIYSAGIKRPYGDHKMSGYIEKVEIARQHLLRQLKNMV